MRVIKAQGLLEPLLEYLDREIERLGKPIKPEGTEWPFLRAYNDGGVAAVNGLKVHLISRAKAPDEAENTEE